MRLYEMARKPHIIPPAEGFAHTHTIIFLHGKGSNCDEFASEFLESEASRSLVPEGPRTLPALFPSIRWVFPSAPETHSERFDCTESQWFDMWAVENPDERADIQVDGLRQSIALLSAIVAREEALLPRRNIFLCGISQGFATAVAYALLEDRAPFASLVGLSTWMPRAAYETIKATDASGQAAPALDGMPVFLGHSREDGVVPIQNGRALRDYLSQHRLTVEWHEYVSEEHWIVEPEGVDDMVIFIRLHLSPSL